MRRAAMHDRLCDHARLSTALYADHSTVSCSCVILICVDRFDFGFLCFWLLAPSLSLSISLLECSAG